MLFVYQCLDSYLSHHGLLGFVITQTLFKTREAGEGFRRFRFERDGQTVYITPVNTIDMTGLHPFEGATNRTATFVCAPSTSPPGWPVPYATWELKKGNKVAEDAGLREVLKGTVETKMGALPMVEGSPGSPWLTAPARAIPAIRRITGNTLIRAHAGVCTWMNGVFWLKSVDKVSRGKVRIANWGDVGKIKVDHVTTVVEEDLVYPLLRGRDVHRWRSEPSAHILLTQDPKARTGIAESRMKREYPLTYQYILKFEEMLKKRPGYIKYFNPDLDPFWTIYNVGEYSVSPFRVVFKELTDFFQCAVLPNNGKPAVADTKLRFIECNSMGEAGFLCGLLNSSPAILYLYSTATWVQTADYQASDISRIRLPEFEKSNASHQEVARISRECHDASAKGDAKAITALEAELDKAAAKLWGITDDELKAIQEALAETGKSKRAKKESADSADDAD